MDRIRISFTFVAVVIVGCSQAPRRVAAPGVNAGAAAEKALAEYDANQDQKLSQEELARCPGILVSLEKYDLNHDKVVDAAEITQQLTNLLRHGTGATQLACTVTYQGKPLSGANIVFEPEPYLGGEIKPAEGITNGFGTAQVGMAEDSMPESLRKMKLIHYGTFKVRVTHPQIKIPAKYNTESVLGYETIPGEPFTTFTLK